MRNLKRAFINKEAAVIVLVTVIVFSALVYVSLWNNPVYADASGKEKLLAIVNTEKAKEIADPVAADKDSDKIAIVDNKATKGSVDKEGKADNVSSSSSSNGSSSKGSSGSSGSSSSGGSSSKPSHQHSWKAHYATGYKTETHYKTVYRCSHGLEFSSYGSAYAHYSEGLDNGDGCNFGPVDVPYTEQVPYQYVDYYYCSCGATK